MNLPAAWADPIERFLEAMVYMAGLTPSTCEAYRRDLSRLAAFARTRNLPDWTAVGTADLKAWVLSLRADGYADGTVRRRVVAARRFFLWLLDENVIGRLPTDGLILGRAVRRRLPRTIPERTLCALIEAVDGDGRDDLRDRAMLELLYGSGLRVTELCTLRLQDVDLGAMRLHVRGKGRKERVVPFGPPAKAAAELWLKARAALIAGLRREGELSDRSAALFITDRGRPFTRSAVAAMVHARIHAFLPEGSEATPHTLRHSFATHLLDHGAPLLDIRDLLGHASVETTGIYTHTSAAGLRETFRKCFPRG